jgi:hypothetical protein
MKATAEFVEIPTAVLASVDTLEELEDWLTANNPRVMAELEQTRREDQAGKFKAWQPRHLSPNAKLKQAA